MSTSETKNKENSGKFAWKPKKSRWTKEEMMAAYGRKRDSLASEVAAKRVVVASINEETLPHVAAVSPPHLSSKVAVVASHFPPDERKKISILMFQALLSTGIALKKYKLVPGLPDEIRKVPIEKKKRNEGLRYTIGDYPVLKNPESFEESAAIFNNSCYEATVKYQEYMEITAMKKNVPTLCLTAEDLRTPFKKDMFREMKPAKNTANEGEVMRNLLRKYARRVDDGDEVHVLWGDSGKLSIPLAANLGVNTHICMVETVDYPMHFYEKYRLLINSGPRRDRVRKIEYPGTMQEYIFSGALQGKHVISNYVPYDVSHCGARSYFFFCRSEEIESKKTRMLVPSGMSPKVMARYAEFALFKNREDMSGIEFYDPVNGMTYNYHHHEVWADKCVKGVVGIPLRTLIKVRSGKNSNTRLSLVATAVKQPVDWGKEPEEFVPLSLPASTVDLSKVFTFNAERIGFFSYVGLLPGDTPLSVNSMVILAQQGGVWKLLDADFSKTFIDRRTEILFSSLPHVEPSPYGDYGVAWNAQEVTSLFHLTYDVELETNGAVLSRISYRGLALCGDRLVYDGFSEFTEVPYNFTSLAASDEKHPWRVRFAKKKSVYYAGFYFVRLPPDLLYDDLCVEDVMRYPPEISERLKILCHDWDAYC